MTRMDYMHTLVNVFQLSWNERTDRPCAPLRLLFSMIIVMFAIVIGQVVFGLGTTLLGYLPSVGLDDILIVRMVSAVSGQFIGSASWVLGFIVAAWFLDRRYPSDMGLQITREWVGEFSVGFLLGIALQGAMLLIGLAAGWLTITGWLTGEVSLALVPWFIMTFVFYLCIGVREEVLFRGYLMTNVAEGLLWFDGVDRSMAVWIAIGISSICFGFWHWGRSVNFLIFAVVFGLLFGLSYALTDSIALPIGLHTAWDMAETSLFASHELPTNKLIETTATTSVTLIGDVTPLDLLSFAALLLGSVAVIGWIYYRTGRLSIHQDIAVPNLHDNHYSWIRNLFVVEGIDDLYDSTGVEME